MLIKLLLAISYNSIRLAINWISKFPYFSSTKFLKLTIIYLFFISNRGENAKLFSLNSN